MHGLQCSSFRGSYTTLNAETSSGRQLLVVKRFRYFLEGCQFASLTDNKPLATVLRSCSPTRNPNFDTLLSLPSSPQTYLKELYEAALALHRTLSFILPYYNATTGTTDHSLSSTMEAQTIDVMLS